MSGTEIELKLTLPANGVAKLKRLPELKGWRQGRATTIALRSVYYDTADHALAQAGITVRLRQRGGDTIQTVKTAGSRASGLFSRDEWESKVDGPGIDTALLAATGLPPLQDEQVCRDLTPVFTTQVRRTLHILGGDGWRVELALDDGEIQAGSSREAIHEAELELLEGPPARLFALARQLAARLPLRLAATSKSDRGFALATAQPPRAVKAQAIALTGDMTLAEAFRAIARNCLHHLLANEHGLLDRGDGEAVHQMRVALRRLRSALKVFGPLVEGSQLQALTGEVSWLLGMLGPARDAEVFLAEIITPVQERFPNRDELRDLGDYWRRRRDGDVAAARAAVAQPRFTALLLDLGAWIEAGDWCTAPDLPGHRLGAEPLAPFATAVLQKLARKMRKGAGKKLPRLSPHQLHRVRIHGKRLRYAGEFFAPLFAGDKGRTREYLATLAELQDRLGEINDIAVAIPRLATSHHQNGIAWAAGLVAGWHEARRPELIATADAVWKRLRHRRPFWRKA